MRTLLNPRAGLLLAALCLPTTAVAADQATGTFTFAGKVVPLRQVYATLQPDAKGDEYLVLLVTDRKLAPADRVPPRLAALAKAGKLTAVRMFARTNADDIRWVPYVAALHDSGFACETCGSVLLDEFNDREVLGQMRSRQMGQSWHFEAKFDAQIVAGGVVELERAAILEAARPEPVEATPLTPEANPIALRRKLASLNHEYTPLAFSHAVRDGDVLAVRLFLDSGMSPDTKDEMGLPALLFTAKYCIYDDPAAREQILLALLAHGATVDVKDEYGYTPLLQAVPFCSATIVRALLEAGADPNVIPKGSVSALAVAEASQRDDIAALLKKAGAKR